MKTKTFFLKLYAISLTFVLGYVVITGFNPSYSSKTFDEITVERINIVEPNGDLKMVISNSKRQHPGMFDGEVLMERQRPPGMIFFNEEQDEVGGLVYEGNKEDGMGMVLSIDQYKNDQVMQMLYERFANGKQQYGLNIWDRADNLTLPELISTLDSLKQIEGVNNQKIEEVLMAKNQGEPISAQRLFAGKNFKDQVGMFINDEYGKPRLKIFIDENNQPKIQVLDEEGSVKELFTD
jgi:hypothetical protein